MPFGLVSMLVVAFSWLAARFFYNQALAAKGERWKAEVTAITSARDIVLATVAQAESQRDQWRELYQAERSKLEYRTNSCCPRCGEKLSAEEVIRLMHPTGYVWSVRVRLPGGRVVPMPARDVNPLTMEIVG